MAKEDNGFTLWLNGLPSSGKSTLARILAKDLRERGYQRVEILEEGGCNEDFFAIAGGDVVKIAVLANLLARNGIITLLVTVSPKRAQRQEIRKRHKSPLISVFLDAPEEVLLDRDSKGFYREIVRAGRARLKEYFASFEKPIAPDIRLSTWEQRVEESSAVVLQEIERFLGYSFGNVRPINNPEQKIRYA